jgi:lysozyme
VTSDSMTLLKQQLIAHEGLKLSAYQDSLGYWTIGVGHLIDARRGGRISSKVAAILLEDDITTTMTELDRALPWWRSLNEVRQRVLVDMCFNLGIDRLLRFKNTLAAIQEGRWDAAKAEMLDSDWAREVVDRATRLAEMMRMGTNA